MKKYKALNQQAFTDSPYSLVPIRMEDRQLIRQWRNEQMYHLRQNEPLTEEQQDRYFEKVVAPLFDQEQPDQILFSYLENDTCIGYGGLVYINWQDQHAEISFIMKTSLEKQYFNFHWSTYLSLLENVAFTELRLHKIYTYAYNLRPELFKVLGNSRYRQEAVLKDHCRFESNYIDVLIHAKLNQEFRLVRASINDLDITYKWATNSAVRRYAISKSEITFAEHKNWFQKKLKDQNCIFFIAEYKERKVGSFRLDINDTGVAVISYLLDPDYHGMGLGRKLLNEGINSAKHHPSINSLYGEVMEQNTPSVKLFESLGFQRIDSQSELMKYQLEV